MSESPDLMKTTLHKLAEKVGSEEARRLVRVALARSGVDRLATPTKLLSFASALMQEGGVVEAVARSLKIQALLAGATGSSEYPAVAPVLETADSVPPSERRSDEFPGV